MGTTPFELLPEIVELVVFTVGSLVLSLLGAYLEQFALTTVEGGQVALGAWVAVMGLVAVYFAYLLFTDRVLPTYAALARALGES